MPKRSFGANAPSLPDAGRRAFLGSLAATAVAASAGASLMAGGAHAATSDVHDPLLDMVRELEAAERAYNEAEFDFSDDDEIDRMVAATYGPHFDRFRYEPPDATTLAGALAALRYIHHFGKNSLIDEMAVALGAALAYFDTEGL